MITIEEARKRADKERVLGQQTGALNLRMLGFFGVKMTR